MSKKVKNESKKVLFLSDVHIGMNEPWDWYQAEIHEPYLLAMLKYACDPQTNISDIVILGDFVDLWLVPPQEEPRTVAKIADANPNVFCQLAKCADSIKGNVYYITGNHDMSVREDDLHQIELPGKCCGSGNHDMSVRADDLEKMKLSKIVYGETHYNFGHGNGHAEHGHDYSLFNHKDVKGYGGMYPLGYFITRLVALYLQQLVKKSGEYENAAQIPGHGHPMAVAKEYWEKHFKLSDYLVGERRFFLSDVVINTLLDVVKCNESLEFVMPEDAKCGRTVVTAADVIEKYKNLVDDFNSSMGLTAEIIRYLLHLVPRLGLSALLSKYGIAGLAAILTDYREDLFPGAIISRELPKGKPVVVMGHTHKPIAKSNDAPGPLDYLYLNTGYGCHPKNEEGQYPPASCAIVEESEAKWGPLHLSAYQYTGTLTWITPDLKDIKKSKKHKIKVCKGLWAPPPATPAL